MANLPKIYLSSGNYTQAQLEANLAKLKEQSQSKSPFIPKTGEWFELFGCHYMRVEDAGIILPYDAAFLVVTMYGAVTWLHKDNLKYINRVEPPEWKRQTK